MQESPIVKTVKRCLEERKINNFKREKMLEIDFSNGKPIRAGDQFGIGRVTAREKNRTAKTSSSQ